MNEFKIEKKIPIPNNITGKVGATAKYPYSKLSIGDSFVIDSETDNFRSTMSKYGKSHNLTFTIKRLNKQQCRIWRIK